MGLPSRKPPRLAKGNEHDNRITISVGFEPDVFRRIQEKALWLDVSFASMVRRLVKQGLEADKT